MSQRDDTEQVRRSVYAIADRAAQKAVRDTLMAVGVDVKDPIEAQKQFAVLRQLANPRTIENLEWLETVHASAEKATDVGWKTLVKALTLGGLGVLIAMTKEYWASHIGWK